VKILLSPYLYNCTFFRNDFQPHLVQTGVQVGQPSPARTRQTTLCKLRQSSRLRRRQTAEHNVNLTGSTTVSADGYASFHESWWSECWSTATIKLVISRRDTDRPRRSLASPTLRHRCLEA